MIAKASPADIQSLGEFPNYAKLSGIPLPTPYPEFDHQKAMPRPYRPFRWPHHQTMSLNKFEPDYWVEFDRHYVRNLNKRKALYDKYGKIVLDYMPGYEIYCTELMEMIVQFICTRYPHYFTLEQSETQVVLHNRIINTKTDVRSTPPLIVLLENVPEDFTIMVRNPENGQYYLRGGIVMSSFGWTVATKIGRPLDEIHEHVPLYKEKMLLSMNRFFANLPTERAIQRGSWTITPGQVLFTPPGHSRLSGSFFKQDPELDINNIYLRVDWQTVRRLPVSGALVFNFRVLFTPLPDLREEPFIPKLCLKFLEEGSSILNKGTLPVEHKAIPMLKQWHQEQVEAKLVPENWEVGTLEEAPFFPGWKEKWIKQQSC
ncbi:hypothetical protein F5884DRAFT_842831 [Xylogone sp. PMI_703]|nr:hypothetical protein F5884DRAFT_842831 [Xylogone sp. PMI_703]